MEINSDTESEEIDDDDEKRKDLIESELDEKIQSYMINY